MVGVQRKQKSMVDTGTRKYLKITHTQTLISRYELVFDPKGQNPSVKPTLRCILLMAVRVWDAFNRRTDFLNVSTFLTCPCLTLEFDLSYFHEEDEYSPATRDKLEI